LCNSADQSGALRDMQQAASIHTLASISVLRPLQTVPRHSIDSITLCFSRQLGLASSRCRRSLPGVLPLAHACSLRVHTATINNSQHSSATSARSFVRLVHRPPLIENMKRARGSSAATVSGTSNISGAATGSTGTSNIAQSIADGSTAGPSPVWHDLDVSPDELRLDVTVVRAVHCAA